MNINSAFPSSYLKSQEIETDTVFTISHIEIETLGQGKDAEQKPVVYFEGEERGLALNKTNANTIASLYGPETDDWIGKSITLFSTEVDFQGKQTLAIRVRSRKPGAPQQQQRQQPNGRQSFDEQNGRAPQRQGLPDLANEQRQRRQASRSEPIEDVQQGDSIPF